MTQLTFRRALLLATPLCLLLASPFAHALELKGRLEWQRKVELRAVDNGVVEEMKITTGQHVQKGDLLLQMDQRKQQAALLEAKARSARTQLALEAAVRDQTRTKELFSRGMIADEEQKDSDQRKAVAEAELASAKASAADAQVALERTELRAPFSGIVVANTAWAGAVVFTSLQKDPLVTLAPDDQMLARALVTADILRKYPIGTSAQINVAGLSRTGTVYSKGVEAVRIEPEGAVYELDILFKSKPSELLRPSETAQVVLP